ncbi:hypothetical protein FPANT_12739 [Fusarium pseudoanthophilum]|uniref:Uncharacterized protein n=1 Tax=Fusarium pseudoanthophilum TaxID=48495 RepID=A0A8H5NQY2_9HYPO|nr:hypothetical protein FPANT_12739 [Fusarium pseudoanthophilum]
MTKYSLLVRVQGPNVLQQLGQQGSRLCLAFGVGNGEPNVIARSSGLGPNIQLQWNDDYAIAATQSNFMQGAQVQASTEPEPIKPGQTYTLNPDFTGSVNDGGPQGGFRFRNQAENASPILYMNMGFELAPIWVGSSQVPRGASQDIKPNNKVTVWFQSDGQTGTMIGGIYAQPMVIDMSGRTSATVVFNDNFTWSQQ